MSDLKYIYNNRKEEVNYYLDLLCKIDQATQTGRVFITGANKEPKLNVSQKQIKMLHSTIFLYLYNLIEWTISSFVNQIEILFQGGAYKPKDLPDEIFNLWIATLLQIDKNITYQNKIKSGKFIYEIGLNKKCIDKNFRFDKRLYKKNLDLHAIEDILKKFDLQLKLSKACNDAINKKIFNDSNIISTIREQRNKLAHGALSFSDASDGYDFKTLAEWVKITLIFTDELVTILDNYIDRISTKMYNS